MRKALHTVRRELRQMTAMIHFEHDESRRPIETAPHVGETEPDLRRQMLADARRMTDGIAGIVSRLRGLDGLAMQEPDGAHLDRIAALFGDIGDFAAYAALAVRRAADMAQPDQEFEDA